MSDSSDPSVVDAQREELAAAFDRDIDPLADHAATFEAMEIDPFELFIKDVLEEKSLTDATVTEYERAIQQWCDHMAEEGRHPTCPNEHHVKAFVRYYRDEKGNRPDTVEKKILRLNKAYKYWQNDPVFPHPNDYNPFNLARSKLSLASPRVKDPPRIPRDKLIDILKDITHIRDRAIVFTQLKLGLRASEVCNLKFCDIHIEHSELQRLSPDLGTHEMLEGRTNAIYVAPKRNNNLPVPGRKKNKSRRPRVLPLDDELRRALFRYLLVRPDNGEPWVFLSKQNHNKMENEGVNHIWTNAFHPEYEETPRHTAVTSHFGRHYFTTYWRVDEDVNRELIKYMRGDVTRTATLNDRGAIDDYIHTYYEDIENLYRERIYWFNL